MFELTKSIQKVLKDGYYGLHFSHIENENSVYHFSLSIIETLANNHTVNVCITGNYNIKTKILNLGRFAEDRYNCGKLHKKIRENDVKQFSNDNEFIEHISTCLKKFEIIFHIKFG